MPAVALSRVGARVVESGPDDESLADGTWQRLEALPDPRSRQGRIYREEASNVPVAQHIPVGPVGLMDRGGGRGLVSSAVRSALVNDLAGDDRGVLGERRRQAVPGCSTRGRDAAASRIALPGIRTALDKPPRSVFAVGFSGLALARRRCRG